MNVVTSCAFRDRLRVLLESRGLELVSFEVLPSGKCDVYARARAGGLWTSMVCGLEVTTDGTAVTRERLARMVRMRGRTFVTTRGRLPVVILALAALRCGGPAFDAGAPAEARVMLPDAGGLGSEAAPPAPAVDAGTDSSFQALAPCAQPSDTSGCFAADGAPPRGPREGGTVSQDASIVSPDGPIAAPPDGAASVDAAPDSRPDASGPLCCIADGGTLPVAQSTCETQGACMAGDRCVIPGAAGPLGTVSPCPPGH